MSALPRAAAQVAVDFVALVAAFLSAYVLRFDGMPPWQIVKGAVLLAPWVAFGKYVLMVLFGVPQFAWRYVGLREALRIAEALTMASAFLLGLRLAYPYLADAHPVFRFLLVPYGVIVADAMFAIFAVVGVRTARRWVVERRDRVDRLERTLVVPKRTLVVGADDTAAALLRVLEQHPELGIDPVGLVDDDPAKFGTRIQGVRVIGATKDLSELAKRHGIEQAIVAEAGTDASATRRLLAALDGARVPVKVVPPVESWVGRGTPSIRAVELTDLLRRSVVTLDDASVRAMLRGRRVLVTGAGGSIGSELARQIARHEPALLLLAERNEHALYEIDREVRAVGGRVRPLLLDVADVARVREAFLRERPEVVFHAAAHKHVPMLEQNVAEAVRNNVGGVLAVVDAAVETEASALVLVSTDKAVNPTSVMGATKRVGERYVQATAAATGRRFCAVRFGNVLGSSGSVVPLFREQIARGGPVTVTHPDVRRYFMTIPEAASLVLEAGALGGGGEITILDMGESVRILDLAEDMIRLSGFTPQVDVPIVFTGLRPGEKLFEELSVADEHAKPTRHPRIHVARMRTEEGSDVAPAIRALLAGAERDDEPEKVRAALARLVPEATLAPDAPPADPG